MEKTQWNVLVSKEVTNEVKKSCMSRLEQGALVERAIRLFLRKMKQLGESYLTEGEN